MKVLVVGSGGREHAICKAVAKSPLCEKLFCAPGNAGIAADAECLPIKVDDTSGIVSKAKELGVTFVIIGPEIPLSLGLADELDSAGILCFGPKKEAAELESSKSFMKSVCDRAHVPTASYKRFTDAEAARTYVSSKKPPIVIKANGLAAGKGVTIALSVEDALSAINAAMVDNVFGSSGSQVVIEDFLDGEEASFFALCDGTSARFFATAQDHKAVYDGDKGPNTGGMGAYSPAPIINDAMRERVMNEIIRPTIEEMKRIGRPYRGMLYAGLMMTKAGPRLIEYNARFGDPEAEVMIPLLKSDLLEILYACARGKLCDVNVEFKDGAALGVVMATDGYPGNYVKGSIIRGIGRAEAVPGVTVYHAATKRNANGDLTSNGGRVLCVTALASTIVEAQKTAYQAVDQIDWPEGFCRRDIGWRALTRAKR
ncbi:MAG: phosphoribosylamine--glycine ligase [Alphaproteobacteria bacterium]|nr:phosphoribosylamine--glycine ligase [Alphaproteobacteria bacterium]